MELYRVADRQNGYFSSAQASRAGYSHRLQHHYQKSGEWTKFGRGIYRLLFYPESTEEQFAKISVWSHDRDSRPQAVVSHESALMVHNISDAMPNKVHVSVPGSFRKEPLPELVLHRIGKCNAFFEADIEDRGGYLITTPARTILDIANDLRVSPEYLETGIEDALDEGLLSISDVHALLGCISDSWRRNIAEMAAGTTRR